MPPLQANAMRRNNVCFNVFLLIAFFDGFGSSALAKPAPASDQGLTGFNSEDSTWHPDGSPHLLTGNLGSVSIGNQKALQSSALDRSALESMVREYLDSTGFVQLSGLKHVGDVELTLRGIEESKLGFHTRFQQLHAGLPVFDRTLSVSLDRDGDIFAIGNELTAVSRESQKAKPGFDEQSAVRLALKRLGQNALSHTVRAWPGYHARPGGARFGYRIVARVAADGTSESYQVDVDATMGTIIDRPVLLSRHLTPTGFVFNKGNPLAGADSTLHGNSLIPEEAYIQVLLENLTSANGLLGKHADAVSLQNVWTRASPNALGNYTDKRFDGPLGAKFESVMAYYHVDRAQDYIQNKLGRSDVANYPIKMRFGELQAHNAFFDMYIGSNGASTGEGWLEFGTGGINAAEDAEVILHEYGHAIQESQWPGIWGGAGVGKEPAGEGGGGSNPECASQLGGGTRAMTEGFADYWAANLMSHQFGQKGSPFETKLFEWFDADSLEKAGRNLQSWKHYPEHLSKLMAEQAAAEDAEGGLEEAELEELLFCPDPYADSEMWSSTLWKIRNDLGDLGPYILDDVLLESHYLLPGSGADFRDGALALLAAAKGLGFSQSKIDIIKAGLEDRGFLRCGEWRPITVGQTQSGVLDQSDCGTTTKSERWMLYLPPGPNPLEIRIRMKATGFSPKLTLIHGSNTTENLGSASQDALIIFAAPTTQHGRYYTIQVESQSAMGGAYALEAYVDVGEDIVNGNFESGGTGWAQSPSNIIVLTPSALDVFHADEGIGHAHFGGSDNYVGVLTQVPKFPSIQLNEKKLTFRLRIYTLETANGAFDKLEINLKNPQGNVIATFPSFFNNTAGYGAGNDVSFVIPKNLAVKGNYIEFKTVTDGSYPTRFLVDLVSIKNAWVAK
jgi:hypothetical protein